MQLTLWDRMVMPVVRLVAAGRRPTPGAGHRPPATLPPGNAARRPGGSHTRPQPTAEDGGPAPSPKSEKRRPTETRRESMEQRYERIAREMLARYGIKVRKWRSSSSGVAWELRYRDGSTKRFIESPRPCGPMSMAIFLHEIGHHAIGFGVYKPRCLEEYHAWAWSLRAMEEHGLNITDQVRRRMHESLWYAISKARRRGIQTLPPELHAFTERPPKRRERRK